MVWGRIDDSFYDHPKVLEAGDEAVGFLVRMIAYSNRHGTNGIVLGSSCRSLAAPMNRHWRSLAALLNRLCEVGLLHAVDSQDGRKEGGIAAAYEIHDFAEYNETREQVAARKEKAREKKARQRAVSPGDNPSGVSGSVPGESRAPNPNPNPNPVPDPLIEESDTAPAKVGTVTKAHELEAWGFKRFGALGGTNGAHASKRLPIYAHELEDCSKTNGKSWGYFWKVLDSYREAQSSAAPAGSPQRARASPHRGHHPGSAPEEFRDGEDVQI